MANNVGCNPAGGSCRWDHNALVAGGVHPNVPSGPIAGQTMILVGSSPSYQIYEFSGGGRDGAGGWERIYSYNIDDAKTIGGEKDTDTGGDEPGGGAKPPSFPSTGPVFTPLDITAPSENYDYSYNYPSTYGPYDTGADFQSKGLLNNFGYDGGDPYQPWSQEYGDNNFTRFGGENLWNYQPPSVGDKSFYYDLSKGPGPKVGFAK
tara:strand:+ start:482 stop:1099 length:618 start_codon:yes stop_codon:yes gene_type:complete